MKLCGLFFFLLVGIRGGVGLGVKVILSFGSFVRWVEGEIFVRFFRYVSFFKI